VIVPDQRDLWQLIDDSIGHDAHDQACDRSSFSRRLGSCPCRYFRDGIRGIGNIETDENQEKIGRMAF